MNPAGIYIHIPFCQKKCGYCDFYSLTRLQDRDNFVQALLTEIELVAPKYRDMTFDTIYLGGGTPTLLTTDQISLIWESMNHHFNIEKPGEFTIEANPGTIDLSKLSRLRELGWNRLSLGAQSFNDSDLEFLERIHTVQDIFDGFWNARQAGFTNINLDLITAFPGITVDKFENSLNQTISLKPEHISCYSLIFEKGTQFYNRWQIGELEPMNSDESVPYLDVCRRMFSTAGYTGYEISNFARSQKLRCKHNLKYWNHIAYLGFGPSAHSFISPVRWKNHHSLTKYMDSLKKMQQPMAEEEILSQQTLEFEYVFLRLRLREGLDTHDFKKRFKNNFLNKYEKNITRLIEAGMIEQNRQYLRLSERGWFLADEIASSF
ncbi:MAG: radical SAM family heme chaperone HemW [bacterium]|nr:MAG: radical SAM family heme chaperone HemW [bacterium]